PRTPAACQCGSACGLWDGADVWGSDPGGRRLGLMHRYFLCDSVGVMARSYSASEAARALGISLDTLRRWDRQGRIRVERDSANRRTVPADEIERLRGS